eukprot:1021080_1
MSNAVSNHLIFVIMTSKTNQIDSYLKHKNKDIYRDALFHFINVNNHKKSKKSKQIDWYSFLVDVGANKTYIFVERVFDLFDDNDKLSEFVLFKQWKGLSLFQALCKMGDVEALKYVLFNKRIQSDNDKCKSLAQLFVTRIPSNFSDTLEALMNGANDVQILNNFSMIFGIYRRNDQVVFQHKAFNYFTLKTSLDDDTEFKVVDDTKDNGSSGGLYSFGLGDHGRLGLGGKGVRAEPTLCATLMKSNITKISCYFAHSLCIDVNGCAYSWGDNEFGQLGLGDCENRNTPQILDALTPYNALSAVVGRAHSLILTDEGNVWSCGKSVYGTLGYVSKDNVLSPKRIETLNNEHIVHISCGWDHSCLISKDGKLFTFGNNEYG